MKDDNNIDYQILWKNINTIANAQEKQELNLWLKQSSKNQLLYNHLKTRRTDKSKTFDGENKKQWSRLKSSLKLKPKTNTKKLAWLKYAATIVTPLLLLTFLWFIYETPLKLADNVESIKPGVKKATLKTSKGKWIILDGTNNHRITNNQGVEIGKISKNTLTYNKKKHTNKIEFNTISTPRGGEYTIILSDGTKVWLNSETELTYPIAFSGNKREVTLKGEAYFDVTPMTNMQFIVNMNNASVHVHGTEFNVMSYANTTEQQITLVEGSISMLHNGNKIGLNPGEQIRINKTSNKLRLENVDIQLYTDWKNGIFRYENMPMQKVAEKLARWYDVQFVFANEDIKTRKITGAFKRDTEFTDFMSLIEKLTNVTIKINKKTILITNN